MFVRMPLTLKAELRTAVDTDHRIREFFRGLGYHVRPEKVSSGLVTLAVDGQASQFALNSTEHHRALARKNVSATAAPMIKQEIGRFCICYCVSSGNETEIFVTRVNEGEVTVWIFQPLPAKLIRAADHVGWRIVRRGEALFDRRKALANRTPIILSTTSTGLTVSEGSFATGSFAHFVAGRTVEVTLLIVTLLLGLATLLVDRVPHLADATTTDPLPALLRTFATATWPSALVAAATIAVTLLLNYWSQPKRTLRWRDL